MRVLFFIILLLIPFNVDALSAGVKAVVSTTYTAAPAGDCPSGTYMAYWTGDHSSGETYWCLNSGASSANASASSGTTFSTEGSSKIVSYTAKDAYIAYAITSSEWNENEGTLYMRVYLDAANTADFYFFEVGNAANWSTNYMVAGWTYSNGYAAFTRRGGGVEDYAFLSSAVATGEWITIGVTWSVGRETNDFEFSIDKGGTWTNNGVTGIATMAAAPDVLRIGNLTASSNNSTYKIDSLVVLAGWKTACPW